MSWRAPTTSCSGVAAQSSVTLRSGRPVSSRPGVRRPQAQDRRGGGPGRIRCPVATRAGVAPAGADSCPLACGRAGRRLPVALDGGAMGRGQHATTARLRRRTPGSRLGGLRPRAPCSRSGRRSGQATGFPRICSPPMTASDGCCPGSPSTTTALMWPRLRLPGTPAWPLRTGTGPSCGSTVISSRAT
jgi:hypothetical protein